MKGLFLVTIGVYVAFCTTLYVASFVYDVNQTPVAVASPVANTETVASQPPTTPAVGTDSRPAIRK